ncbi:MAG TPA: DOMON-like domain-containing protein [Caulobacteraceae bacterium]|nr:DOMON-like domain-containing protein [Caulobacteraceae bacterium]
MRLVLQSHPDSPPPAPLAVQAQAERLQGGRLRLRYRVEGDVAALALPAPAASERADELWATTCFEAFVRSGEGDGYHEINLSPSTRWAVYRFDAYREGMTNAEVPPPRISADRGAVFELEAEVALPWIADAPAWRVALTAVIEHTSGRKSYWSLAHAPGRPDFHHPHGFALELSAMERA